MNPRISKKERGLLKGAIRRVFSRSDLRRKALAQCSIPHEDPRRPRVKKWGWCASCGEVTPQYLLSIDHINPVVPTDTPFEAMSIDVLVNNIWCEEFLLQALCERCHSDKTKAENALRRKVKKEHK